ncbi:glycosyltransferase family 8 protein [Methylobacterium sp. JK268]
MSRSAGTASDPAVVPIAFCFDQKFAAYAAVAITSALCHADARYRIYCLFPAGIEHFPAEILNLDRRFNCEIVPVIINPDSFSNWRIDEYMHFSPANYYRLLIPELIPEKKLIYLDCDLVVTCGLADLYGTDLEGKWVGACVDRKGAHTTQMSLAPGEPYVNSGVMLLDLESLRQHRPTATIIEYYQRYEKSVTWVDQCLINKFAEGRKLIIDERWNVQFNDIELHHVADTVARLDRNAIFHFSGPDKPWMDWSASRLIRLWDEYARLTGHDYETLKHRPTDVTQWRSMAIKYENEQDWKGSSDAWKNVCQILLWHIQRPQ